jgi:high-affinity iron transporter
MDRSMSRSLILVGLIAWTAASARGGEVKGRIEMPDTCSPTVSPAVVTLEPIGATPRHPVEAGPASVNLTYVNQHGLQFEPRVQVATVGQTLRFTNQDAETHNVHILTPGFGFNQSMRPGVPADFIPNKPGLIRLVCDIHAHMRGFVVVTDSPWAKLCKGSGSFRFQEVPEGRYLLKVWHEMGEPLAREFEVKRETTSDLGTIVLKGYPVVKNSQLVPVRAWPDVTDRIGVLLSESREIARQPEGLAKARTLVEDAYWGEFEASEMETAVRRHLGFQRAGAIEGQFLGLRTAIKKAGEGKVTSAELVSLTRKLLIDLALASHDLMVLKVVDRRDIGASGNSTEAVTLPGDAERAGQLKALGSSFVAIRQLADAGRADEARSAMTDAYFSDFEPIERLLNIRRPQEVTPLETRFNAIQGRIGSGLRGADLAGELDGLRGEVVAAIDRCDSSAAGSFSLAFANSLITILREGVEVILLLTMLVALVAKTGDRKGLGAIRWGIGVAFAASLLTAVGLNFLVASAQGRTREVVEGAVMMAAAGVLFSVSYWLISQTQAKRWADFLKERIARGAQVGGLWTLGLTAFLAVYREGAETALLYQAMIAGQGGARDGLLGLAGGLAIGLVLLTVLAIVLRRTSLRLPLRPFFQVTGYLLFGMAVVFAGNGVFELQGAGYVKTTAINWLGSGLPALGIHPNTQSLSIQGLLVLGAVLALVMPGPSNPVQTRPKVEKQVPEEVEV